MLGGKWQGASVLNMRYQNELPIWAKYLDKTNCAMGGHMLGFIAITTFRVLVLKDYV